MKLLTDLFMHSANVHRGHREELRYRAVRHTAGVSLTNIRIHVFTVAEA